MPRILIAALLAALLPGCAPSTPVQRSGQDQEVTRDILLRYRQDPHLAGIDVTCSGGVITLQGRVENRLAYDDALRLARQFGRGCEVVSKLEIRAR